MAQRQDIVISHFSHPGHDLVKRHHTGLFHSDMCWEDLSGTAYICHAGCDFCIHESCAGHSQTFSSPEHHVHPLTLVQTRRDATLSCDVCFGQCAPSSFLYRCPPCGFDMHPNCARLSQVVRRVRDPTHDLTLVIADGHCVTCDTGAGLKMPLTLRLYDQGSKSRLETPSWTCGVLPILYAESTSRCDAPDASTWQVHTNKVLQHFVTQ